MFVVVVLWSVTQKTEAEIDRLIIYFSLFYLIFDLICTGRVARFISRDVRRGELNGHLLKPVNYIAGVWIKVSSNIVARVLIPIILLVIFAFVRPDIAAPSSLINFVLFLISIGFCFLLWNFFVTIVACVSFWVNEVMQLLNVINLLLNIVIGRYIPLYLFPAEVQNFISFTPANYFGNFQILLFQGQLSAQEIVKGFGVMTFWIILFAIITNIIYKRGLRIYEASGN